MARPRWSILLLTLDGGDLFARSLQALFACRGIEDAEVLMIDSGSRDDTLAHAARYPIRIHRIRPHEFGHGRTRNLAASRAHGEILVFLVQDAVPARDDFLERLTAPLENPETAAAFGRQIPHHDADPVEGFYLASTYPERQRTLQPAGPEGLRRLDSMFFSNVCSALRRSVWARHPFDESLIMSEDQKWAKEALAAGHRIVYVPEALVVHSHRYRLRQVFQRHFDSGMSLVGIAGDSILEMARYELRHLAAGMRHLWRSGQSRWIPRFLSFEAARVVGFALGRHSRLLPRRLRRSLSLHKGYWTEPPDGASKG